MTAPDDITFPFDEYPEGGRKRLGPPRNSDNCRHGYCRDFQRKTKQTRCAYCGVDLTHDYYRWLLVQLDHVIPVQEGLRLGIPQGLLEDATNRVLCCSGCNGFDNRYRIEHEATHDAAYWEENECHEFYQLRDRVFQERFRRIAQRRMEEMRFFDGRPWEGP
jgi:hypothetical protein